MATQETTPGSQTEESNALDLPSAYDIRDYVLQRPSQQTNSEAFSSEEACSIPCSSDVDPGRWCSVLGKADWELLFKPKPSGGQNRTTCREEDLWWCFPSPRMGGSPILYTTLQS
ncbi:shieldin complex subunit 1 isoform X3 [Bubalus kerabau]|uniref:shieldin complex subunit 1 isoform X2 n=1 Tax=Bubalus bubalis TaxID=89462 RepID=UPI000DBC4E13|nr:shieldin complex subunit 1 isoform X2 [Bubalus bubalis]XP_055400218.1 shieldin complex subunit 1 isoform X3 [Bubalus carabanensis]